MDKVHKKSTARVALSGRRKQAALSAGVSLLIMAVAAGVAYGYIHGQLVVAGDGAATAANIRENAALFALEVALWFVIVVTDVIVSVALWRFFREASERLAKATAAVRLLYTAILAGAVVVLATAGFAGDGAYARVATFERIWSVGLIVFGAHLFLLGLLSLRAGEVPRVIAWLLVGAGPAYSVIHTLNNLGADAARVGSQIESVLAAPMALAELALAVWLIVLVARGRRLFSASPAA